MATATWATKSLLGWPGPAPQCWVPKHTWDCVEGVGGSWSGLLQPLGTPATSLCARVTPRHLLDPLGSSPACTEPGASGPNRCQAEGGLGAAGGSGGHFPGSRVKHRLEKERGTHWTGTGGPRMGCNGLLGCWGSQAGPGRQQVRYVTVSKPTADPEVTQEWCSPISFC